MMRELDEFLETHLFAALPHDEQADWLDVKAVGKVIICVLPKIGSDHELGKNSLLVAS